MMVPKNWVIASMGLGVAVLGGFAEVHRILILGGCSTLIGLVVWMIFSGSSLPVSHVED